MRDFVEFAEKYRLVEIPVRCGDKKGKIFAVMHQDRENSSDYISGLSQQIEIQKYFDSEMRKSDEGPTIAIANLMESGSYCRFLQGFKEKGEISGIEQALEVIEDGRIHHKI